MQSDISAVVLAYGEEPVLDECVRALLANGECVEVVLVDNGSPAVGGLSEHDRLRVLTMPTNLGYAGGCNAGAAEAKGDVLVFVNSDAIVESGTMAALARALEEPEVGLVTGRVLLADAPGRINTVGNPVHFTGVSWAGHHGEPADAHEEEADVTSITGALFAVRRQTWDDLGGFDDAYFAYHEDVELSLRTRQRGLRVRYCPEATAIHHYAFHRNPQKLYLLERNRLQTVLTTYPGLLLTWLAPALLLFELAACAGAFVQGWLPAKLRGYGWLLRRTSQLRARRRQVQAENRLSPYQFALLLETHLRPPNVERPPGLSLLDRVLATWFRFVLRQMADG